MMRFIALDFETANEKRNSPCAIGMVRVEGHTVTDRYYTLIKPEPPRFSPWNIKIHGITPGAVANAPTFDALWPDILAFINGDPVVAHNASFDMSVLRYTLDQYNLAYPDIPYFCSVIAAKKTFPHLSNHRLNTVSHHIGFNFHHHNALEDAEACARVVLAAIAENGADSLEGLCRCIGTKFGHLRPGGYSPCR